MSFQPIVTNSPTCVVCGKAAVKQFQPSPAAAAGMYDWAYFCADHPAGHFGPLPANALEGPNPNFGRESKP